MSHHGKAAIAACFATVFIITGTVSLAQSGGQSAAAVFGVNTITVR